MNIRDWWNDDGRRKRFAQRQDRASDAKFYTLLAGLVVIGICMVGDWLGF